MTPDSAGPSRKSRRLRRFIVYGLIIVAATIAVRWNRAPTARRTGGRGTVRFVKAGFASMTYDTDGLVQHAAHNWLPAFLSNRWPPPEYLWTRNLFNLRRWDLILVFQVTEASGAAKRPGGGFHPRFEMVDSDGFVYRHPEPTLITVTQTLRAWNVASFPRRDPRLHVKVFDGDEEQPLMELNIANPGYLGCLPGWLSTSMPITQTVDPVSVTIQGISLNSASGLPQADLQVAVSDPAWAQHTATQWMEVATGNRGPPLSPFESVWKVHVDVSRTADAGFSPYETWTLPARPLPGPLQLDELQTDFSLLEIPGTVQYLADAGAVSGMNGAYSIRRTTQPADGVPNMNRGSNEILFVEWGRPFFRIDLAALGDGADLMAEATDQNGRLLSSPNRTFKLPRTPRGVVVVGLDPAPDSKTVSLRLIANRPRSFEFFVQPPPALVKAVRAGK